MSYDISIWCTQPFDDPAMLPTPQKWTLEEGEWSYDGGTWLLNAGPSESILEGNTSAK